jgi:hypothetical protein
MLVCTTWKGRPLSPEQAGRMMDTWGKLEAKQAEDASSERLCWYLYADGSGGVTVSKVSDADAAAALQLETSLALSEFLEIDSRICLDLDAAMPAIVAGVAYGNG